MKKKTLIFIFLFFLFLIVVFVATLMIIRINKTDSSPITGYTTKTFSELETDGDCKTLENGKKLCYLGSVLIKSGGTITENYNISLEHS